jgi:hypothetical protein
MTGLSTNHSADKARRRCVDVPYPMRALPDACCARCVLYPMHAVAPYVCCGAPCAVAPYVCCACHTVFVVSSVVWCVAWRPSVEI